MFSTYGSPIRPAEITPLDHRILRAGGSTAATERLPNQLQQAKASRSSNLLKQNLDLVRENGRLRKEIAYHEERGASLLKLYHRCCEMQDALAGVVRDVSQEIEEHEKELLHGLGITYTVEGDSQI